MLALPLATGGVQLWNVPDSKTVGYIYENKRKPYLTAVFSPSGHHLLTGTWEDTLRVWDVATLKPIRTLGPKNTTVSAMSFSPDHSVLAAGEWTGTIRLYRTSDWAEQVALTNHSRFVSDLAFSPDGRKLFSSSADKTTLVWSMPAGDLLGTLQGHQWGVTGMDVSPDGSLLASGTFRGAVKLWRAAEPERVVNQVSAALGRFVASPDGRFFVHVANTDSIVIRDSRTLSAVSHMSIPIYGSGLTCYALGPDARKVAVGFYEGSVQLWEVGSTNYQRLPLGTTLPVRTLVFSLDGQRLISGHKAEPADDGQLEFVVWDVRRGKVGGSDGVVRVWDLEHSRPVFESKALWERVYAVDFSPKGLVLAAADSRAVSLFDLRTQELVHRFPNTGGGSFFSVAFAPEEPRLATGNAAGVIRLVDLQTYNDCLFIQASPGGTRMLKFAGTDTIISANQKDLSTWRAPKVEGQGTPVPSSFANSTPNLKLDQQRGLGGR
jgi:WD40 repeat protein